MAKLLNSRGFTQLLKELNARYIKQNEFILKSPTILYMNPSNHRIVLNDLKSNQYIIVNDNINYISIGKLKSDFQDNRYNKIYIQFSTNDNKLDIKFSDMIFWKNGQSLIFNANHLYRIELIECMGIWVGTWHSWKNN